MLRSKLLHPEILRALASAGQVNVVDVLKVLAWAVPIETAEVMTPEAHAPEPPIFSEFRDVLGSGLPLRALGRFPFYEAARDRSTCLVVATGEERIYANILLTIGVVPPS
jgi:L-fucose mutarotase